MITGRRLHKETWGRRLRGNRHLPRQREPRRRPPSTMVIEGPRPATGTEVHDPPAVTSPMCRRPGLLRGDPSPPLTTAQRSYFASLPEIRGDHRGRRLASLDWRPSSPHMMSGPGSTTLSDPAFEGPSATATALPTQRRCSHKGGLNLAIVSEKIFCSFRDQG